MYQGGPYCAHFLKISYYRFLLKSFENFQVCLKSDEIIGHFTRRRNYVLLMLAHKFTIKVFLWSSSVCLHSWQWHVTQQYLTHATHLCASIGVVVSESRHNVNFITTRTLPIFSPALEPGVTENTLSLLQHFPFSLFIPILIWLIRLRQITNTEWVQMAWNDSMFRKKQAFG